MADYISEASASPEIVPANSIETYDLEMALEALDVVEDWMNWVVFGVGGPA